MHSTISIVRTRGLYTLARGLIKSGYTEMPAKGNPVELLRVLNTVYFFWVAIGFRF